MFKSSFISGLYPNCSRKPFGLYKLIAIALSGFVFAEKRRPRGTQHLFALIHAIKNVLRIRFSYGKSSDEYPKCIVNLSFNHLQRLNST
jgi:hypothetical protein